MDDTEDHLSQSLFWRFSVWICGVILVIGVVAAGLSFYLTFEEVEDLQDDQLREVAWLVPTDSADAFASIGHYRSGRERKTWIWVIELGASPSAAGNSSRAPQIPPDLKDGFHTISANGVPWRVYVRTIEPGKRLAAAQRTARRDRIARDNGLRTLLPVIALIPLLSVIVALLIRYLLKTIKALSIAVDEKGDANLSALPVAGLPREIAPFVRSINRLLLRLDETLAQQRRFVAHAAHELRSPLTALTLQVENLAAGPLPSTAEARLAPISATLARMSAQIEQLLEYSRPLRKPQVTRQRIPALPVVKDLMTGLLSFAEANGVDLGMDRVEAVDIQGGEDDFRALVRNAIDNAVRYTPRGGSVDVSVFREGADAVFEVIDSGPGIPPEEMARVFDPFYRILGSGQTGSGLGLAIVKSAAERLGGRVRLENLHGPRPGGLRFRYAQPALMQAPPPPVAPDVRPCPRNRD